MFHFVQFSPCRGRLSISSELFCDLRFISSSWYSFSLPLFYSFHCLQDFGSIFSTLLPGTTAKLAPPEGQTELDGLEVKVAFGNVWKESLSELSGGQRFVCLLYKVVIIPSSDENPCFATIQIKANEQYFHVVLFIITHKMMADIDKLYAGYTENWVFKRYSLYRLQKEVYGSLLIFVGIVFQSLDETKAKVEVP